MILPIGKSFTWKQVSFNYLSSNFSCVVHAPISWFVVLSCKFSQCGLHGKIVNNGFGFEKYQAGDYSIALSEKAFTHGTFRLTALYEFINPTPSSSFCAIGNLIKLN